MAGCSSVPRPLACWPPWSAGLAGGGAGWGGLGLPLDRCLPAATGHPLAGQAGPAPWEPPPLPPPREPPPLMGGADPRSPERAWLLTGPEDAGDAAGGREAAGLAPAERPAPRDQPEADPARPADPFDPLPFGPLRLDPLRLDPPPFDAPPFDAPPCDPLPFDPLPPGRGGRSRGGATRPPPLSASARFLARAEPTPLTTRREPELTSPSPSPSPSAAGGASGRSRDA
jgi:hypothetical protein